MNNLWDKIVKMTLTGQLVPSTATPILEAQLKTLHIATPSCSNTEQLVLKTIGSYAHLHKFAQKTTVFKPTTTDVIRDFQIKEVSKIATQYTSKIISVIHQKQSSILEEILQLVIDNGQRVAPSILPQLLAYTKHKKELNALVVQSIGDLGIWLANQNPDWQAILPIDLKDKAIFEYGTQKERVRYIAALRAVAPTVAIQKLEAVWQTENVSTKVAFLETLNINLQDTDIDFLEQCQADKRKNVRTAAAQLLAQIPTSKLAERMQQYLSTHVLLYPVSNWKKLLSIAKKQKVWEITLEDDCSSQMQKDGISPQRKVLTRQGKKVNQLAQIIAKTPPQWWEKHYNLTPIELLKHAAVEKEWFSMFFWGWAQAAHYYQNQTWLLALHQFQSTTWHQQLVWKECSLPFLYSHLPPAIFEQAAHTYLTVDQKEFLNQETPLTELLLQENYKWSLSLSKIILQAIQNAILSGEYAFQWNIKALLKRAAIATHPMSYAVIVKEWQYHTDNNQWGNWQTAVQHFIDTLHFRYQLYQ